MVVNSLFADRDAAVALAQHLAATYGLGRRLYEAHTPLLGASIRRGMAIHITYPVAGFRGGAYCDVIGAEISTALREARVTVLV